MSAVTNLPASVSARLLHRARQTGDDHHGLLTSYCLEPFSYRLGPANVAFSMEDRTPWPV